MTTTLEPVSIRAMREADIEAVAALARTVWCAHYPGIISAAQIDYMLDERYCAPVLRAELERAGLWWDLLHCSGTLRAFASYFLTEREDEMKLDKLYVHPGYQRRGLGLRLIESASACARARRCTRLVLAVNKNNASAIAAYRKHGFFVEQAVVKPIGGGFLMDDYIMVRSL